MKTENEDLSELRAENEKLRAALIISRGQWIHSINARQCLAALGEPEPDWLKGKPMWDGPPLRNHYRL